MDMKFAVHSPHSIPMVRQVTLDGQPAEATVHGFEVELQALDGISGTLKYRTSTVEGVKAAKALFTEGAVITASFTGEPAKEPVQSEESAQAA